MPTKLEFDVVIVGSGAGGGTVASELALAAKDGLRVAVFESGGEFKASDNTQNEYEMASRYYIESGGLMNTEQTITFALAKAIGGATTVYTGTSLEIPKSVIEGWGLPSLTYEDLAPRYLKYKLQNNVQLLKEHELNRNNTLFRSACSSLSWSCEQFPINVKDCQGLGTCNLGCARLAKQGTHVVQLPYARQNGVQIFSWARVIKILGHLAWITIEPPRSGLEPSSLPCGEYVVHFKKLVLAAGAFGTPSILQRSEEFSHLDAVGRYFTCHPSVMIAGKHDTPIESQIGHPKSFFCDEFLRSKRFLLETCMYYPFTLTKNLWGFGEELDSFVKPFSHLQMVLAFAIDQPEANNRVIARGDENWSIHYSFSDDVKRSLSEAMLAAAEILFESGAKNVHVPTASEFLIPSSRRKDLVSLVRDRPFTFGKFTLSGAHLMGTCRMGVSSNDSVTDPWGRVHEHPDVYIADASLFPKPSEVNPYLTVMVIADRVAEALRRDLKI